MKRLLPLAWIVAAMSAWSAQAQTPLSQKLAELSQPYVDSQQVVGLSIGVIQGDTTETLHLGKTALDESPPNDDTLYEIGSVSKVFTGVLLADAVARGKLKLNQPAQSLMPEPKVMPLHNGSGTPITLLHLSTHQSGLPRLPNNMPSLMSDNPYADYDSKLAYEFLGKHSLRRSPGSKNEYSNFAVSFLGHLLCLNANQSYDDLLEDRITQALGMPATRVTLGADLASRMAKPHDGQLDPSVNWDFADLPGAGGIRSSLSDMLSFARANLQTPDGEIGQALELAWKQHAPAKGNGFAMGLGWHIARDGQTRWHNGQTGGYHSMLIVNRDQSLSVTVLSNTAT
ncbi:MAG: serine hydrolase domain-containing protein, partial [Planctomycetota bacterium]